jgi:hypothetical protein
MQTLSKVGLGVLAVVAMLGGGVAFVACGGSNGADSGIDGGGLDANLGDGGAAGDANLNPDVFGPGEGGAPGSCMKLGSGCMTNGDCCSGTCTSGVCDYPACTSDNGACTANGQCCSQTCTNGKCAALTTTCKTIGNSCAANTDCCSGLCKSGTCQPGSFCGQIGDACLHNTDCCGGTCTIANGNSIGTCGGAPAGASNCGLTDGMLCGGSGPDGGVVYVDGGLPQCGGACCSRACAPWGPTGVLVCQPASGCHPVGDLCQQDTDCCGANGLPGGSGKPVTCDKSGGGPVGICRLPMGCKPNGDVCKLKTMSCNSSCDCCAGNCETMDTCKQDNEGVPRCAFLQCVNPGNACASSADCCNGLPCVPNPSGNPPYVCYAQPCVKGCGACTNNADCCPGTACIFGNGGTQGVCGPCGGPPGDGGTTGGDGGTTGDGGTIGSPDGGTCGLFGQICTQASDCCNGVPCTDGRCNYPIR